MGWMRGLVLAALTLSWLGACYKIPVGEPCDKESDCAMGLRCFEPNGTTTKVCTARCDTSPCEDGTCIDVADGKLCTKDCASAADCGDSTSCQRETTGKTVCWPLDPALTPIKTGVSVAKATYREEANIGAVLRQGRYGTIEVFAVNTGAETAPNVGADVSLVTPELQTTGCYANGDSGNSCISSSCQCTPSSINDVSGTITLDPGETGSVPLIILQGVHLDGVVSSGSASFNVLMVAGSGETWNDVVSLPTGAPATGVVVTPYLGGNRVRRDVPNGIFVAATNLTEARINGLAATITSSEQGVTFDGCCSAWESCGGTSANATCNAPCDCLGTTAAISRLSLDPGEASGQPGYGEPLIYATVRLDAALTQTEVRFDVKIRDDAGHEWTDSFTLEVAP